MGKTFRGSSVGTWMGKSSKLGMSVCSSKKGLFLSVYVDDTTAKFQVVAWMVIHSRRRSLNQLENYHKFSHNLS